MLALSRNVGQSVRIGKDVVVHIIEIRGQQVKLSFDAPKDVVILRTELEKKNGS